MISPKLIFQCSSASLLAAAVVAAPMWVPDALNPPAKSVLTESTAETEIRVEPHHNQHVLRSADDDRERFQRHRVEQLEPADGRSIEERNRAAQQMLGELENTLEFHDSPQYVEAVEMRQLLDSTTRPTIRCKRRTASSNDASVFKIFPND